MINQQNIFDENLINIRKKRIINKFSSFLHSLAIDDLKERLVEIGDEFLETLVVGPFAKHWAHNISQKNFYIPNKKNLTSQFYFNPLINPHSIQKIICYITR